MFKSSIPMQSSMQHDFKRFLKVDTTVIQPYFDKRFMIENLVKEKDKAEKLKLILKKYKNQPGCLKIFDDASLTWNCTRAQFLNYNMLDLSNSQVTESGINELVNSIYAVNIEEIELSQNPLNIQDDVIKSIAESPNFIRLKILILTDTGISDVGMQSFFYPYTQEVKNGTTGFQSRQTFKTSTKNVVQASQIKSSTKTDFFDTKAPTYDDDHIHTYKEFVKLPSLTVLVLYGNHHITDDTMRCIASSFSITSLKYLDVRATGITDHGVSEYLMSANSKNLQYLDISYLGKGITTVSIQAFCKSKHCTNLVVLKCRNSLIGDEALQMIAESKNCSFLEDLDIAMIDDNKKTDKKREVSKFSKQLKNEECIGDEGLGYLMRAKYLSQLEVLNLSGYNLSRDAIVNFLTFDIFKTMKQLHLSHNSLVSDKILDKIGQSDKITSLKKLYVISTEITEPGLMRLQKLKPLIEVIHSISQTTIVQLRMKQAQVGIRCYCCEQCSRNLAPDLCYTCQVIQITTKEFPAKLCDRCGFDFQETTNPNKKCIKCLSSYPTTYSLYRCYVCSIGMKRFNCVKCKEPILTVN